MGDIMKVETSGASRETVNQHGLGYSGVSASHTMAQTDAGSMASYTIMIKRVGAQKRISPALIAAIISRESRAGNALTLDGWGNYDHSRQTFNGFGLMQVDKRYHTPEVQWDSEEHISQATGILVDSIGLISKKFRGWSPEKKLKGGIAAYKIGVRKVLSYDNVDEKTTGKDYSNDVVARAQWYSRNGYEMLTPTLTTFRANR